TVEYAEKYDLPYINFYDLLEETDINYETDTYDGGLHLNRNGAGKLAGYLGKVLTEQYGIPDHRNDADIAEVYQKKYQFYEDMIQAQQEELDRYGEIRNY
ncbi:MAG: SGNH/GDSL hydrolase family protein, partial [Lachnospiraceae bacterium]|nr:SGNH/GDSL hydrolase family protein [Lachnospiraceae bacterium]